MTFDLPFRALTARGPDGPTLGFLRPVHPRRGCSVGTASSLQHSGDYLSCIDSSSRRQAQTVKTEFRLLVTTRRNEKWARHVLQHCRIYRTFFLPSHLDYVLHWIEPAQSPCSVNELSCKVCKGVARRRFAGKSLDDLHDIAYLTEAASRDGEIHARRA